MPKLVLQYDGKVLKEVGVGRQVMIGRQPDNGLVIDNPAVSSRHARVFADFNGYAIEDLESVNGTFVNDQRITRHTLQDGDHIQIGKHRLQFVWTSGEQPVVEVADVAPPMPELGGTMVLDTRDQRELVEKAPAATGPSRSRTGVTPVAPSRVGTLTVLAGKSSDSEFTLSSATSLIGKSDTALVRLKGWFKPGVAAAIARKGETYTLTALKGKTTVNGQPVTGRQELKDGDVIEAGGLTLEFRLKG